MSGLGHSRTVTGPPPDERVPDVVRRHLTATFSKPVQDHNRRAFDGIAARLAEWIGRSGPLVLDAGCGTGVSTRRLAQRHPAAVVIGVDKSAVRLARGVGVDPDEGILQRGRLLWVRADLVDLWRLFAEAGWRFEHQYLLYPNPWPKSGHLRRRWHGHPVFPVLVRASSALTLRTNWRSYAVEFCAALSVVGVRFHTAAPSGGGDLSPFEAKYRASGHRLIEVVARPAEALFVA